MKRIYLAGPIEWVADGGKDWRLAAGEYVKGRALEGVVTVIDPTVFDGAAEGLTPNEIVTRDRYLLKSADGIIFDARSLSPSWGTAVEMFDAWQQQKPTVAWGAPEKRSAFLSYHVTKFVDTIEEAVDYMASLLLR